MKFSKNWLSEYLTLPETTVLSEQLTMAGLEVDAIEAAAGVFSGVVVGEILSAEQHPNADKLKVCQVKGAGEEGEEVFQVVCGASNARPGIKIPFAMIGAKLPGDFKIKKAKLRGVESFGMLCAAEELGLAESSDGLMELASDAPVGTDFREYLNLDDECIELGLTPNRGDCLSMRGLAREAAVLNQQSFADKTIAPQAAQHQQNKAVNIHAEKDCPRYACRVITNVSANAPSPIWLQEKLRRSGVRSIDAIVDVTNYVLLELGQPMHAFDLDKINGDVQVRYAQNNEKLTLLDGQTVELKNAELLIADDDQALALAGIMGGESSAVSSETKNILLEAAFFEPVCIAGRARSLGLHTDSSHRFERGVDFELPALAIERATELLLSIVGGEAGDVVIAESSAQLPQAKAIELQANKIEKMLGVALESSWVEQTLTGLGFECESQQDAWLVTPPSWRFDVSLDVDLLEELARIYGYDRLPISDLKMNIQLPLIEEKQQPTMSAIEQLLHRGYQEIISYSFIAPKDQQQVEPNAETVSVQNPISADMSVMRTSLIAGLLNTLEHNLKRQQTQLKFFEQGLCFEKNAQGELVQSKRIAGLISGLIGEDDWSQDKRELDFYDIKADVEALLGGAQCSFQKTEHNALHPGQSAVILDDEGQSIGLIGALHPQLKRERDFDLPVFVFELDLEAVSKRHIPVIQPVTKFPEVRRDLAFLVDKNQAVEPMLAQIRSDCGDLLKNIHIFDVYQGEHIDSQQKSIGIGLVFSKIDATLTDDEVNSLIDRVIGNLKDSYNTILRE